MVKTVTTCHTLPVPLSKFMEIRLDPDYAAYRASLRARRPACPAAAPPRSAARRGARVLPSSRGLRARCRGRVGSPRPLSERLTFRPIDPVYVGSLRVGARVGCSARMLQVGVER